MNEYEALLRLQDIDLQLMRLSRTLKDMPQQKKMAAIKQAQKRLSSELSKVLGQRKDAEMDIADSEEQRGHLLEVVERVRAEAARGNLGYREVADIESQLASLAKKIEKIDFGSAERGDRLERTQRAEKNALALQAKLASELAEQEKAFSRASADLMAQVRTLAAERKQMLALLSADNAERYERASKRFGGLAVERLTGNVPSVCRVKLQPSQFADLRSKGPIAECPYCHRMLVTEEVAQ